MVGHVVQEIIAYRLGIPTGTAEQTLESMRSFCTGGLRQLPTVLAIHLGQQTMKIRLCLTQQVPTRKSPAKPIYQLSKLR